MLGLLDKARKLRDTLGLGTDGREEFAFDADSGISREEQQEIRQEIEKVATSSRMKVSPEMFVVKAAKQGVLFPVLVNVVAIVALAVGLGVLYFIFQRGESQAARQDTTAITAEEGVRGPAAGKKPADRSDPGSARRDRQAAAGPAGEHGRESPGP